jgi:MoaA/NifB/PqqE/SkfB family radical SAM enzyme
MIKAPTCFFKCIIFCIATNGLMLRMAAKLKDLGNSVLGRFGMSVDNFKTVQDPNTGSYSIQFQK